MRMLLFHAKEYGVKFDSYANRPAGIVPEPIDGKEDQGCNDCVVAFITVEKGDGFEKVVAGSVNEISKMCKEVQRKNVAIVPFAHLSNNLANYKVGLEILKEIEKRLGENFNVVRTHFGSNKSLHLDVYGHVGNARYREF